MNKEFIFIGIGEGDRSDGDDGGDLDSELIFGRGWDKGRVKRIVFRA